MTRPKEGERVTVALNDGQCERLAIAPGAVVTGRAVIRGQQLFIVKIMHEGTSANDGTCAGLDIDASQVIS